MRKKLAFVLTIAIALLLLGGCGEKTESEPEESVTEITINNKTSSEPVSTGSGDFPEMDYATASQIGLLTAAYLNEEGRGYLCTNEELSEVDLTDITNTVVTSNAVTSITAYSDDDLNVVGASDSFTLSFLMATENDVLADEIAETCGDRADAMIEAYCTNNTMEAVAVETTLTVVVLVPGNVSTYVSLANDIFTVENNADYDPAYVEEPSNTVETVNTAEGGENIGTGEDEAPAEVSNEPEPEMSVSSEPVVSDEPEPETSVSTEPAVSNEPEPSVSVEPEPETNDGYTYTDLSAVMYTTARVNVRSQPSTDGNSLGVVNEAREVTVTGKCNETGWYRVVFNGAVGYISNDYLTDTAP